MSMQRRVCERCGAVYRLEDSFLEEALEDGRTVKVRSAMSYKYCKDCQQDQRDQRARSSFGQDGWQ